MLLLRAGATAQERQGGSREGRGEQCAAQHKISSIKQSVRMMLRENHRFRKSQFAVPPRAPVLALRRPPPHSGPTFGRRR
ncbi:hypothetical protein [Teichococcus aestuarii]|uniref:hypothetical protein n=1 Tax=Teichococcus aestuarii TaxID=568898 RepID=UPI003607B8DA